MVVTDGLRFGTSLRFGTDEVGPSLRFGTDGCKEVLFVASRRALRL